jgi:hypothetical protein
METEIIGIPLQKSVLGKVCGQGLKSFFEKYAVRAELVPGAPSFAEVS